MGSLLASSIKSPSIYTKRSVSQEMLFQKSKNPSPVSSFFHKSIGTNKSLTPVEKKGFFVLFCFLTAKFELMVLKIGL